MTSVTSCGPNAASMRSRAAEVRRRELSEAGATIERLRTQFDQLLDAVKVGETVRYCSKGLHLMLPYNKYRHGGKERCRACRRLWQAENRKASDQRDSSTELQVSA